MSQNHGRGGRKRARAAGSDDGNANADESKEHSFQPPAHRPAQQLRMDDISLMLQRNHQGTVGSIILD